MKRAIAMILMMAAVPALAAPNESLYQIGGSYTDQRGQAVKLGDTKGHPTFITMFYGACPEACPLLISKMKLLEQSLSPAERADLRVTLVSLDPKRDTPEALTQLAAAHRVDLARWRFLRTDEGNVQLLAATLGIKFHPLNNGAIWHSSVIVVLDREGKIVNRVEGLEMKTDALQAALATARN